MDNRSGPSLCLHSGIARQTCVREGRKDIGSGGAGRDGSWVHDFMPTSIVRVRLIASSPLCRFESLSLSLKSLRAAVPQRAVPQAVTSIGLSPLLFYLLLRKG